MRITHNLERTSVRPGSAPPEDAPCSVAPLSRARSIPPRSDPRSHPAPDGEVVREIDLSPENVTRLLALKTRVYGRSVARATLEWQYLLHPLRDEVRAFGVEQDGALVGATLRLPATLRAEGRDHRAHFNVDSMIHPDLRRQGRMRRLYRFSEAAERRASARFSKGSSCQIYPLLMSSGYMPITPATFLVCYPSATRWLMSRLRMRFQDHLLRAEPPRGFGELEPVRRFNEGVDELFERASRGLGAVFRRDAAYMNWRYVDIPHRRYMCFQRAGRGGRLTGIVVLAEDEGTGRIVDVLWDPEQSEGLHRLVRFARALLDGRQAARILCFATHPALRDALAQAGFIDRGMTPRFSALLPEALLPSFQPGAPVHVVDGDGDTEMS